MKNLLIAILVVLAICGLAYFMWVAGANDWYLPLYLAVGLSVGSLVFYVKKVLDEKNA